MTRVDDIQGFSQQYRNQRRKLTEADIDERDREKIKQFIRDQDTNKGLKESTLINHLGNLRLTAERTEISLVDMEKEDVDDYLYFLKRDDLPYCMEKGDTTLLGIGSGNFLDPDSKYSDGDSLSDGEEVTERWKPLNSDLAEELAEVDAPSVDIPDSASEIMNQKHAGYRWSSLPNDPNTDGVGFDDGRDLAPRKSQTLTVGLDLPTVAEISTESELNNANDISIVTSGESLANSELESCDQFAVDGVSCIDPDREEFDDDLIFSHSDQTKKGIFDCLLGCNLPDDWSNGVDLPDDEPEKGHLYILIEGRVFVDTNGFSNEKRNEISDTPYSISNVGKKQSGFLISENGGELPNAGNGKTTNKINLIYKMKEGGGNSAIVADLTEAQLEHVGSIRFNVGRLPVAGDNKFNSRDYGYSVAASELLIEGSEVVQNSGSIYSEGIGISQSLTSGLSQIPAAGLDGAAKIAILEYSAGKLERKEQSLTGTEVQGMKVFASKLEEVSKEPEEAVVEDGKGTVTLTGPSKTFVR